MSRLRETRTRFYHFRTAPVEIKWLIVERLVSLLIPLLISFWCTPFLKPLIFRKFWWRQWQREWNCSGDGRGTMVVVWLKCSDKGLWLKCNDRGLYSGDSSGRGLCSCHVTTRILVTSVCFNHHLRGVVCNESDFRKHSFLRFFYQGWVFLIHCLHIQINFDCISIHNFKKCWLHVNPLY